VDWTDRSGQVKGAVKRAGIANFHPHDCRHIWAKWHYAANCDLVAPMAFSDWKSELMVLRYAHMNVARREQSVIALSWEKSPKPVAIALDPNQAAG
jgi:integrase